MTPAAPQRVVAVQPRATPGSSPRGFLTDYGYVVGELKRILVLTAGIVLLLLVLWLIIG